MIICQIRNILIRCFVKNNFGIQNKCVIFNSLKMEHSLASEEGEQTTETTNSENKNVEENSSNSQTNGLNSNEYNLSNNINSTDIDKDTENKLRGDAIGETMYSQSFVLKTLLLFSDLRWTHEVEEDLCFLWDMTLEKDVCEFLFNMSYPSLVIGAINKYPDNNRFVEIVIGILANLFCSDCETNITQEEVTAILSVTDTDDHLILIQIIRFISSVVNRFKELSFINSNVLNKITFILENSVNKDLLIKSLESVSKITLDFKVKVDYITGDLVNSVLIAYATLMLDNDSDEVTFESFEQQSIAKYLIEIVCNICAYINHYKCQRILKECQPYSNKFTNEIVKLFKCFTVKENLLPIDDSIRFFIDAVTYVCSTLSINYLPQLFLYVIKIFYLLIVHNPDECNVCFDLVGYFISVADVEHLKSDLMEVDRSIVSTVLSVIRKDDFSSEYSYKNNFLNVDDYFNKI